MRSLVAMYGIHALNLSLPLATLPVLTRMLGPQEYGRYGVMLNLSGMALIFIEFGLGVPTTKAITGADEPAARRALARVVVHQTVNALLVLPVLGLLTYLWLTPRPGFAAIVLMLAAAWSMGLTTLWFRIARASVPRLLPATLIAKLVALVIFLGGLPLRPTLGVALAANLASGFWPVLDAWAVRSEILQAARSFSWADWRQNLQVSFAVPAQRLGSALYLLLPTALVAGFFGMKVAGWYVLSDRIIRAGTGVFQPLTSTLFPLMLEARGLPRSAHQHKRLRMYLAATIGFATFASIFTFLIAEFAVRLIGGEAFAPAALFLRWMSPLLTLVTINMVLTSQLYVQDREALIARAVWVCGLSFSAIIFLFGRSSPSFFVACCMLVEGVLGLWLWIASRAYARRAEHHAATLEAAVVESAPK